MQLILQAKRTASSCKTDVFTQIFGLLYGFVVVMENRTLLHYILAELKALMQLLEDDTQHEPWSLNVWCHLKLNVFLVSESLTHYDSSLKMSVMSRKRSTRGLHYKCNKGWFFLVIIKGCWGLMMICTFVIVGSFGNHLLGQSAAAVPCFYDEGILLLLKYSPCDTLGKPRGGLRGSKRLICFQVIYY